VLDEDSNYYSVDPCPRVKEPRPTTARPKSLDFTVPTHRHGSSSPAIPMRETPSPATIPTSLPSRPISVPTMFNQYLRQQSSAGSHLSSYVPQSPVSMSPKVGRLSNLINLKILLVGSSLFVIIDKFSDRLIT